MAFNGCPYPVTKPVSSRFDLAIALGILSASVQVPSLTLDDVECLGELALSGAVRAVRGVLPAALAARKAGRSLMVPRAKRVY